MLDLRFCFFQVGEEDMFAVFWEPWAVSLISYPTFIPKARNLFRALSLFTLFYLYLSDIANEIQTCSVARCCPLFTVFWS